MKLPIFLVWNHWKNCRQWMTGIRTACYFYSGIWLVIEIVSHFLPPFEKWSRGNFKMLFVIGIIGLVIGVARFLQKCAQMLSVREKLEKTDTSIEIRVGNIFNIEGDLIIATNTTFETDMSDGLIPLGSLQGQFTKEYYSNIEHLKHDLEKALKEEIYTPIHIGSKEKKRYEFGTVAKLSVKDQVFYLVAIDELNQEGGASSSLENVRQSLMKLWKYIGNRGEPGHLVIPIIGTKSAGIQVPRDVMITEIIKSFISATYLERKFCEKLTIVIHKKDYSEQNIDLQELGNYLHAHATQKKWEIQEPEKPVGESIQSP